MNNLPLEQMRIGIIVSVVAVTRRIFMLTLKQRSTHYGLSSAGACGFGLYSLCTKGSTTASWTDPMLGDTCTAFCTAYPLLCQDPANVTLRGNFAAPNGDYFTQVRNNSKLMNYPFAFSYLSRSFGHLWPAKGILTTTWLVGNALNLHKHIQMDRIMPPVMRGIRLRLFSKP